MSTQQQQTSIEDRLLSAIVSAGLDPVRGFRPDALGALDHFHTGGRRASEELLELLDSVPGSAVLDIGAGIGGPARLIAAVRGHG